MIHFIYHHRTGGRGAEGMHILNIVKALEALGHAVTIASPPGVDPRRTAGQTPLDKGAGKQTGINSLWQWLSCRSPQWVFELAELAYNLYAALRLVPLFRRAAGRPAAFYERNALFLWAGVAAARWFGLPVVLEVNEVAGLQRARKQSLVGLARWIERRVLRKADVIVTVSSYLRDELVARGAAPESVHVFPNAIDPARFAQADGAGTRSRLGLADRTVAGFAGWFDRWDRLELFVELAARLVDSHPQLAVLLVGDGPVRADVENEVRRRGLERAFRFTGPVPRSQVADYIDAMDICLLPDSNLFGSPMVLFEFMALGKAVIAPDVAPVRDVLTDGETGLVVPRGCVDSLETALRALLDAPELRRKLGAEARRAVMRKHTWEASAKRVVELLAATPACTVEERL